MPDNKELIKKLSQFVLQRRVDLFEKVISFRTRYITVVLEDIFQAQNASAVLRSCDCFGIQDVHIIQNKNIFNLDKEVTMGSDKWISIHRYKNTENAIRHLRKLGYRIIATTPDETKTSLYDQDINERTAIMFGTELTGLTDKAFLSADELMYIPMFGFTESFNVSVSAALCLQLLVKRLHSSPEIEWQLTEEEKDILILSWLRKTIKKSGLIEKRIF